MIKEEDIKISWEYDKLKRRSKCHAHIVLSFTMEVDDKEMLKAAANSKDLIERMARREVMVKMYGALARKAIEIDAWVRRKILQLHPVYEKGTAAEEISKTLAPMTEIFKYRTTDFHPGYKDGQ